jgi:hypothetical protein
MIKNGLIVVLFLLAIYFMGKKQVSTVTKTTIDTVTVVKRFEKFTNGDKIPFKILDTIYTNTENHDTTYIIKDYEQVKEFTDSIHQDSNLFVIKDTISKNRIIGRSFKAKIQEKTITITNNIQAKPKSALYIGFRSDLSNDMSRMEHNISLSFKTRQRGLFSVGYGMSGYSIGYAIKL